MFPDEFQEIVKEGVNHVIPRGVDGEVLLVLDIPCCQSLPSQSSLSLQNEALTLHLWGKIGWLNWNLTTEMLATSGKLVKSETMKKRRDDMFLNGAGSFFVPARTSNLVGVLANAKEYCRVRVWCRF
jgi:hypothetical protein